MTDNKRAAIAELHSKREGLRTGLDTLTNDAKTAARELTADEVTRFDTEEAEIKSIDAQITALDEQVRADTAHAEVMKRYAPSVQILSEPEVYRKRGEHSYFRDLYRSVNKADFGAAERLRRNDAMVAEKRAGLTTANGAGGEMVPPLWLVEDFVKYARPGRVTANLVPNLPLPAGTDSINIPKILTGTGVANMAGQNTAITETDLTTTSVSSSVYTIAGGQTVSLQLLEQSPISIDEAVLSDLAAAYAVQLNTGILTGNGTNTAVGIMSLAGTNAIDCGAPTGGQTVAGKVYASVANAISQVHTNRFMPADTIIMHPRRWAWLTSQVDASGRPLVTPAAGTQGTGFNLLAQADGIAAQGFVGTMQGLPVYIDALLPTNLTADSGTGEDAIIVGRLADLILWESDVRAEAFTQTYAQNLSVYLRMYNYASFQAGRYPASLSIITGSSLAAPTF